MYFGALEVKGDSMSCKTHRNILSEIVKVAQSVGVDIIYIYGESYEVIAVDGVSTFFHRQHSQKPPIKLLYLNLNKIRELFFI